MSNLMDLSPEKYVKFSPHDWICMQKIQKNSANAMWNFSKKKVHKISVVAGFLRKVCLLEKMTWNPITPNFSLLGALTI